MLQTTTFFKGYSSLGLSLKFFPYTATYSIEIKVYKNIDDTDVRIRYLITAEGVTYNVYCGDGAGGIEGEIAFNHTEDPSNTLSNAQYWSSGDYYTDVYY